MDVGVILMYAGMAEPDFVAATALAAVDLGFESVWVAEHVIVPVSYDSRYPYDASGELPIPFDTPFPDPMALLAFIAAITTRIRLGTGIVILPERDPVFLAKEAATVDRLSGGRLELGIGIGWLREEFDAVGIPFEDRGRRMEEQMEAMRALWREPVSSYHGEFVDFEGAAMYPKPARPTGVPLLVGGHSTAAAERAGRLGDGFFPYVFSTDEAVRLVSVMRRAATSAGRDPDSIPITLPSPRQPDDLDALSSIGVTRVVVPTLGIGLNAKEVREKLARVAERYLIAQA